MNRYFLWPNQRTPSKPLYFPNDFIVCFDDGAPRASSWANLTKAEKSVLPTLIFCNSLHLTTPSEVLLAGLCGIRTRKAVRNALHGLEERGIISINRDTPKFIRLNFMNDKSDFWIAGSIIHLGHWQVLGRQSLSAQALYVALRSLKRKTHTVLDSIDIICQVAGISTRHYKTALSVLEECELVSLWEGSNRKVIPRASVQFGYREEYLESLLVQ